MNKPILNFKIILCAVICCLVFSSCSEDDNKTDSQEINQIDVEKALQIDEISNFIDGMTLNNLPSGKSMVQNKNNECITYTGAADGYTLTFNDCTFGDNEVVNGIMTVSYKIADQTVSSTITFTDLSYGGNKINGSKTNSYSLNTDGGSFVYSVTSDLLLELEDGTDASEKGTKTYTIIGLGTADASYTITGNWEVTYGSESYALSVETALEGNLSCEYITKGILKIIQNGIIASVDFGDGTCDDKAIVAYPDGTSLEITL